MRGTDQERLPTHVSLAPMRVLRVQIESGPSGHWDFGVRRLQGGMQTRQGHRSTVDRSGLGGQLLSTTRGCG